jgi:thiamine biosynthesis protein ThiS
MNIVLNGEPRRLDGPQTLAGLVETLGLDVRKVAIERNLEIAPRSTYGQTSLSEGDRIEIVHFIGGG